MSTPSVTYNSSTHTYTIEGVEVTAETLKAITSPRKTLDITSGSEAKERIADLQIKGNPDTWRLLCKASTKSEGWMKSTKAMMIPGVGALVQVSTQQGEHVAEALALVPGVALVGDEETGYSLAHVSLCTSA